MRTPREYLAGGGVYIRRADDHAKLFHPVHAHGHEGSDGWVPAEGGKRFLDVPAAEACVRKFNLTNCEIYSLGARVYGRLGEGAGRHGDYIDGW